MSSFVARAIITYLKDFKESVDWDSTLVSKGKKVHILVSLVEDSNFFIPLEYTSSVSNSNKVIKQMCTKIELFSNDKPKSFLISVDDIKKYMGKEDEKIIKYGVLQLSKDDVSYSHDTLKLVYGYSIPYTDIGNQVTVLFNCTSLEKSINVEY